MSRTTPHLVFTAIMKERKWRYLSRIIGRGEIVYYSATKHNMTLSNSKWSGWDLNNFFLSVAI
jgi:hypothetical protein